MKTTEIKTADDRIKSLKREGWKPAWMAVVFQSNDEIAVVLPDGRYYRGRIEDEPKK